MHTKGKWEVDDTRISTAVNCGAKHIAMVNYSDKGKFHPSSVYAEEHAVNARLIAAAPDLLEALILLSFWLEERKLETFYDERIKDALSKAGYNPTSA